MEAIVLAGGLGTRLRSTVPDVPKPLAPVAGRPFLAIVLDALSEHGFKSVMLSVGFRHEQIRAKFGTAYANLPIRYSVETEPLGTGGAIRASARQCADADVFVLNGDSRVDVDHAGMLKAHQLSNASITLCVVQVRDAARYGCVQIDGDKIVGFSDKGVSGPGWINAGVYVMARGVLETMGLPAAFSFERDVLAAKLHDLRLRAFPGHEPFIDIGVPEDYARAQLLFAATPSK